jgi:hypothetical protein
MIQPTVGKRLWYWPTRAKAPDEPYDLNNQPLSATITHVNADGTVNIGFLDRNGEPDRKIMVPLWQRGIALRPSGAFCEYHPDDSALRDLMDSAKVTSISPTHSAADIAKAQEIPSRPVLSLKKANG